LDPTHRIPYIPKVKKLTLENRELQAFISDSVNQSKENEEQDSAIILSLHGLLDVRQEVFPVLHQVHLAGNQGLQVLHRGRFQIPHPRPFNKDDLFFDDLAHTVEIGLTLFKSKEQKSDCTTALKSIYSHLFSHS